MAQHKRPGRKAKQDRIRRAMERPRVLVIIPEQWKERWDPIRPGCLVAAAVYIAGQEVSAMG